MKINHVIIQAGGLGTRMGKLTKNRPKCLISVENKPMIFHAFDYFPECDFVIICDYKDEVLRQYLRVFANCKYRLVVTRNKGNLAGIKKASELIEDGSVLIMWSDLILKNVDFDCLSDDNYIGVTDKFQCSRFYENYKFVREGQSINGVAGCFVLLNSTILKNAEEDGSFVDWIENKIQFKKLYLNDTIDVGTIDRFRCIDNNSNRCRPYNRMIFQDDVVTKIGLTPEGQKLIEREVNWYKAMEEYGFRRIPKIMEYNPLVMQKIDGDNVFCSKMSESERVDVLMNIMVSLDELHSFEFIEADKKSMFMEYYEKTLNRLKSVADAIPFSSDKEIFINGKKRQNILFNPILLERAVEEFLGIKHYVPIHGDCTLTNTMVSREGEVFFIDARGYFGIHNIFGDPDYDWAKLYYSIIGNFDQFNIKNFSITIGNQAIEYKIDSNGWEQFEGILIQHIGKDRMKKIKLIHSIIWLSMASHVWEDYDSMCLAFYNGLVLFDEYNN